MKHNTLFKTLVLALLVAGGGICNRAHAQQDTCAVNVIHTYMNGRLIPWDSAKVRVQDSPYHSHTFWLYAPDTILSNCTTGVNEHSSDLTPEIPTISPNPCSGKCSMRIALKRAENVTFQIADAQGRVCFSKKEFLPQGVCLLSLQFPENGIFFVHMQTSSSNESCKVLCVGNTGGHFDIQRTATLGPSHYKDEKGGEGLFGMTDKMLITAYITYNGEVKSEERVLNYDADVDDNSISEWMYHNGSINIHFTAPDSCDNFTLFNKNFDIVTTSEVCLSTMEYPVAYHVTFYDSTFYSEPTSLSSTISSTWQFSGWHKYRYYPDDLGGCICIGDMNGDPLPDSIPYYGAQASSFSVRHLKILSCDEFGLGKYVASGNSDMEIFVKKE